MDTTQTFANYLFNFAFQMILKAVAREGFGRYPQEPLIGLILNRIGRLERRLNALVVRWRAGTLPVRAGRVGSEESTPHPNPPPQGGREKKRGPYPRGFGWLRRFIPFSAPPCSGAVLSAIYDPEMETLHAAAPQVGRILRPLCHMIAAGPLPEWLKLPKRARVRKEDTSPRPTGSSPVASLPHSGEGEGRRRRTPREMAEAAVRRSEATGEPVDARKMSSVAYGYFLHPPRDDNCPPPEIGYGGRRWRPPKDYEPPRDWD